MWDFRVVFLTNSKWFPLEIPMKLCKMLKILQVKISHGLCYRIVRHTGNYVVVDNYSPPSERDDSKSPEKNP